VIELKTLLNQVVSGSQQLNLKTSQLHTQGFKALRLLPLVTNDILGFYKGKIAQWQIPDKVIFADALPIGGTGKILKNKLRENYEDVLVEVPAPA